jgi:hypothetical protein
MPAPFDIEHSLLMQASGAKAVSFGPSESELPRRHEVKRYWGGSHRWIESLPPKLAAYELTPGRGMYKPSVEPHCVHNRPAISLSVALCFTAVIEREHMTETFNGSQRSFHLHRQRPGQSPPLMWPKCLPCDPGGSSGTCARDRSQNGTA